MSAGDLLTSDLPAMDVAGRADRLRALLGEAGCDALLVTNLVDIRYLTGFSGSAGLLLVDADRALLVSDGRYEDQAAEEVGDAGAEVSIRIGRTAAAQRELLAEAAAGRARLGLQAGSVTWSSQQSYAADWFPDAELVPTSGLVERLRIVKDDGEVARMALASAIADAALAAVRPRLAERLSERELGLELDTTMRHLGADDVSFESIIASGPNGAKPHARPGRRTIADGDLVVLDFGALVEGYHSDMTRTIAVGEPSSVAARMLEVVLASQAAGVAAVAAGVGCADVDRACRDVIADAGWGDAFVHGTGHGVGLDIHEAPAVSATSTATLAAGHVVTVEPGVYLPEHGGVRIEDTVVVTDGGCRPLTNAPKTTAP